jgi:hypothetical protein
MEKLAVPTIHLNGTSKAVLIEHLCEAGSKLKAGLQALSDAAPNGRDYYVQGPNALEEARKQAQARYTKVLEVIRELEALELAIDEQEATCRG